VADGVIDAYVSWREECAAVNQAYARWNSAAASSREAAFARYGVALEREARAADRYQSVVEGVSRDLGGRERGLREVDRPT